MNIKKIVPIIGFLILIYILININLEKIYLEFLKINPLFLILSIFLIFPILFLSNYEWQILLKKQKIKISYLSSLKNIFIGYFLGFISPGGYGAYARIYYLKNESKSSIQKCFSNVLLFNTIDYISLIILSIIGIIILINRSPDLINLLITLIVLLLFIIFLLIIFLKKELSKNLVNKILKIRTFNQLINKQKFTKSIELFLEDLPNFSFIKIPFMLSILGWLIQFIVLYIFANLFSININFLYFIAIISIANIITTIPITIYGLGTREFLLISLFSLFNIIPEKIISFSLYWFVILWLFPSIIGGFITIKEGYNKDIKNKKLLIN